jgi:hypothetical protein
VDHRAALGAIQELVSEGALQLSLFDRTDLAEITHPDYPGERLIVCRNPLLATERARKREELMQAAERKLAVLVAALSGRRGRGTTPSASAFGSARCWDP